MNNISTKIWLLIATVFAIAVTMLGLGGIATQPWHVMPELGADGGKNIFTYLYHILYGKGLHFTGMNYPYGEHIVYTDGQPILSVPLSYMKWHISISTALNIMWWFISLSYVLAIVYCFKILRYFNVQPVMAMLFAGLIIMCSPQVLRLSGHYALSFCCLLPMLFYWTLVYYETGRLKYCLYILLMGCFTTFLHPYYAAVGLVWAGFYTVACMLAGKGAVIARIKHTVPTLVAAGLVLVIFGVFMKLTDPVTDRPAVPYGVLDHVTHIKDIFSSGYSPLWAFVKEHSHFSKISYGGEGYTYTGLAVITAVISAGIMYLWGGMKRTGSNRRYNFPAVWLIVALLALLLGSGAPFTWGMSWLLNYASALRQFRTLGRFSWIFYYIITIYGAVVISYWHRYFYTRGKKAIGCILLVGVFGIWIPEATGYIIRTHNIVKTGYANYDIFTSKNDKSWPQFLAEHHLHANDFQAILVLPFFATGSEKLWVSSDENISAWSVAMGVKAGVQLGLPMMDIMMSRSSWEQTFNQVKIAGGPYTEKTALADLNSFKLLLVLQTDGVALDPDQQYLLTNAVYLGHYLHCNVYGVGPQLLLANDFKLQSTASTIALALPRGKDTCISASVGTWFVNHYDEYNYNTTPFGIGALRYATAMGEVICDVPVTPAAEGQLYEFSCWYHVPADDYRSPKCILELVDANGNITDNISASTIESTDNRIVRSLGKGKAPSEIWLQCGAYFRINSSVKRVRCRMLNFAEEPFLAIDELMIRPANALIIGNGMANNHLLSTFRDRE